MRIEAPLNSITVHKPHKSKINNTALQKCSQK